MHSAGQTLEGIRVCLTVSSECCLTSFHNQVRIFCYITKTVTVSSIFSVSFSSFHFPVFHLFLLTAANIFLTQQHASCVHASSPLSVHSVGTETKVVRVFFPNARPGSWKWGTSWHVHGHAHMHKHTRGSRGEIKVENLSPERCRKEEIRAGEREWHAQLGI